MVCSAYSFVLAYAEKETASEFFGIFKLFSVVFLFSLPFFLPPFLSAAAVSTWLKLSVDVELEFSHKAFIRFAQSHRCTQRDAPTHTHTHKPLTTNHSWVAFTSTPCRDVPPVERVVWQHLKWHYVPLAHSTVTYCSPWKNAKKLNKNNPQKNPRLGRGVPKCKALTWHTYKFENESG